MSWAAPWAGWAPTLHHAILVLAVPHNPLHVIHSGADQRELERPEGPRKWVSLSIRMLIMMRGRRRSSAEDEVGQAQPYLVRKHQMFYNIIQVRREEEGVQQGRNEDRIGWGPAAKDGPQ